MNTKDYYERRFIVDPANLDALTENAVRARRQRRFYLMAIDSVSVSVQKDGEYGPDYLVVEDRTNPLAVRKQTFDLKEDAYFDKIDQAVGIELDSCVYIVDNHDIQWTLTEFWGALDGLITASCSPQSFNPQAVVPVWLGEDITFDPRYNPENLALNGLPHSLAAFDQPSFARCFEYGEEIAAFDFEQGQESHNQLPPDSTEVVPDAEGGRWAVEAVRNGYTAKMRQLRTK